MTSLGLVSPARRTANNTSTRRTGGSSKVKHVPVREYYIPASTSVQELQQTATRSPRLLNVQDAPATSTRRRDESSQQPSRPHSPSTAQRASPIRQAAQPALQATRTTSVARRVVLRGPDSVRSNLAASSSSQEQDSPSNQPSRNRQSQKVNRREAQSPTLRPDKEATGFRYEKTRALKHSQGSDARQQTFRTRVNQLSASHDHDQAHSNQTTPSSRQYMHLPSPSTTSTDDLDSDFILQFARDHQLEIGAEVAQSLARASNRRNAARSAASQAHETQPPQRSPLLSPNPTQATPQPSPTQSIKPPRPPKSSRRLSASPSPISPVPPTPPPKAEANPEAEHPKKINADECAYASVFDDADEEEPEQCVPTPSQRRESYSRRTSMSSTRPSRGRKDRSFSNSSRNPSQPGRHNTPMTPHTPATPATPQIPPEHVPQASSTRLTTTPQQTPVAPVVDESPSDAKILISQFDDHAREDYERNRRLSSLLKGLGIQTRAKSPEPRYDMDFEEEEVWEPVASSSSVVDMYSETEEEGESGKEEEESVVLTGDSFETAPEEGTEVWAHGRLDVKAQDRHSADSLPYEMQEQDYSGDEDDKFKDEKEDVDCEDDLEDIDEKSWYEEDSRSIHNRRRWSYSEKPQPLPPELTLEDVRKSLVEQRASLGITDSVLAGILATESFCMPDGVRLSLEQIASRLSMDRQRRESENFSRSRRTTSGHTLSSLPYAARERLRSMASENSATSPKPWLNRRFSTYRSEGDIEILQEPEGGYDEEDLPPLPVQELEPSAPTEVEEKDKKVDPSWRHSNLSTSEALALRPLPLELPSEDEASRPVENIPARKRTRSISAFQRLSSTFTGSSNKPKSRKRLPSFFGGFGSSNKSSAKNSTTSPVVSQPSPTMPISPAQSTKPSTLEPPPNRKRASTGPPRLVDIANEVTNTPDPSLPQRPASPADSTRSRTMGQLPGSTETWRSSVPEHLYATLARSQPKLELKRQEVIYELYRTEESFVNGLKGVVRVFSQPLRTPQGRWIAGVPTPIARLLDWLDDIVYLHSQITSILAECRHAQGHLVQRIADTLLDFMPRLEVHQPYLIRFESVTKSIDDMLARPDSDFGEFVRMQQALPECGAMPLSSFLLKPVQRLMKYPLFFKQLRDLTPANHPDYEGTQDLLDYTDMMIRAMESVKIREEEYESLKVFANKIVGLPTGLKLAKRDRRLLGQGMVYPVELSDTERHALELDINDLEPSYHNASSHPMTSEKGPLPRSNARRSIISDSAYGASPRPASYFSDAGSLAPSLSTTYSAASTGLESITSFSPPVPTSLSSYSRATSPSLHALGSARLPSTASSLRPDSMLSPPVPNKSSQSAHSRQKSTAPSGLNASATSLRGILKSSSAIALPKSTKHSLHNNREQPLHLFVFSDLVLFTSAHTSTASAISAGVKGLGLKPSKSSLKSHPSSSNLQSAQKEDTARYTVVDDWGVAKLIGITDLSGRTEHENLYKLDLLPLWSDLDEKRPFTLRTAALSTTIYVTLPNDIVPSVPGLSSHRRTPSSSTLQRDSQGSPAEHALLVEALDRSYIQSLRDVSFSAVNEEVKGRSRSGSLSASRARTGNLSNINTSGTINKTQDPASIPRSPSQQLFKPNFTSDNQREMPHTPSGCHQEPSSPSLENSMSARNTHRPDDIAEREERAFWSYRFKQVKDELNISDSLIEDIINSGLLHCPIEQIEQIISNLNGNGDVGDGQMVPVGLVNALREIKSNERKLKEVMKEARKGVRMIPSSSNTSVGLAITYDDRSHVSASGGGRQTQHRLSEESQIYTEEDDDDQEGFEEEDSRQYEVDENIPYQRECDSREDYRDHRQLQDSEDSEAISESEYDSEDHDGQSYASYDETEEEEDEVDYRAPARRVLYNDKNSPRQPAETNYTKTARPKRISQSPRAQAPPKAPAAVVKPAMRSSPRAPAVPSSSSMQRDQQHVTSSSPSLSSTQHRYGAYYQPTAQSVSSPSIATSTPKMASQSPAFATTPSSAYRSSPIITYNSPKPASSVTSMNTPTLASSNSMTTPNHFALASQMRRERQASIHHSSSLNLNSSASASPKLNAKREIQKRRSRERMHLQHQPHPQPRHHQDTMMAMDTKKGKQNDMTSSPSLETVFIVQRAQRVPVVRRL